MLEEWEKTATELVEQYNQVSPRVYWSRRYTEKLKLRREIREIKERRDALLLERTTVRLPYRTTDIIKEILAEIPP